jgi:hypothetical protein
MFYGMFFTKSYIIPVILIYRLLSYYPSVVFGGLFALFAPEKPLEHASENEAVTVLEGKKCRKLSNGTRYRLQYIRKQRFIQIRRCQEDRT